MRPLPLEQDLDVESLRELTIAKEREFYTSDLGFLDFVRDSGAAPDAEYLPHGKHANQLIKWNGEPDPGNPSRILYKWKLTLWPRGSFKSQVFNVGMVAWEIAKNPNIRILVCSETDRQAKKFVQEVMKIVESPWFVERFGQHKGRNWKIGSGSFESALRTKKGMKDPTLAATGTGAVQTGAHWDMVVMDDVCSQENTGTDTAIETLKSWFGETMAQLDPGCRLFMIGTLHHFADIYCYLMETPAIRKKFDISCHGWCDPLIDPNDEETETTLFFPSRLTRRYVAEQKAILPPRLFACFYENRPTSAENQIYRPEYFRHIPDRSLPTNVWTYILTDFAFIAEEKKKKGKADRTCFWVVALDPHRVGYVLDVYVGRWKPSDSIRLLCRLWDQYQWANVKGACVERASHKELISSLMEEIRRETMTRPRIIEIEGRSQEIKDMRIEAAEPRWRNGDIYFMSSVFEDKRKFMPVFKEMTQWPLSEHDDVPDAISDLDKRDSNGMLYCPGPPPHWNPPQSKRFQPPEVNGRFNPDAEHSAWDRVQQRNQRRSDLWKEPNQGNPNLWQQRPNRNWP